MTNKKSFIALITIATLIFQIALMPITSFTAFAASGVSVEDFEDTSLPTDTTVNKAVDKGGSSYGNLSVSNSCSSTFQRNTAKDAGQLSNGNSSLKVNVSNQANFKFFINLSSYKTNLSQNGNIAFYVNLPAGTVNLPSNASDNAKAAMTDGKYGIKLGLAANNDQDTVATTVLANTSFTYYFEDGTTYTAQNESGIYPYKNKNGEISTEGFKGYVSVSIANADLSTTPYLIFTSLYTSWAGFLQSKTVYFDDFRLVGDDFTPYQSAVTPPPPPPSEEDNTFTESNVAIDGFENVTLAGVKTVDDDKTILDAYRNFSDAKHTTVGKSDYEVPEGNQALKVEVKQPSDGFYLKIKDFNSKDYTTALNTTHNLAFYIDISEAASTDEWKLISTNSNDYFNLGSGTVLEGFTVTYFFPNGTKKVMENQSKFCSCDVNGNVSSTGFKGYIAIDLKNKINTSNGYLVFNRKATGWADKVYYFDDFRCIDPAKFTYKVTTDEGSGESGAAAATSSLEDFEKLANDFVLKDNGYTETRVSTTEYYGTKFSIDNEFLAQGAKSMKATMGGQGNFEFYVQLKKADEAAPTYKDLAFYLHLPEGTYTKKDGTAYGVKVRLNNDPDTKTPVDLTNAKITYYFKSGAKLEKTGENGIFPYDKDGKISKKGFDGYVSISIDGQDITANPYAVITATEIAWGTAFANNDIHFDDFRGVDAATFVPYDGKNYVEEVDPEIANGFTISDFEAVNPETYDPTKWDSEDSNIHCEKFYGANFTLDKNSKLQGKNCLKISTSDQGAFHVNILPNANDKDASRFDGVGMYLTIPMGDYLGTDSRVGYALKVGDTAMANATVTYFFANGKKVTKTGQDGIYSYNESGTITDDGFKGYVVVSFDSFAGIDKTNISKMSLGVTKTYKDSFKNTTLYLDDIRFVYAKTFDPYGLYSNSPNTGDSMNGTFFILSATVIAAAAIVVINRKRFFA